ncbi:Uncharacterized protein PECH_001216 [Penicillium ucsense]|uniref:mRNA 3'-end-processing protein RNA14 n=1 Tax=Penicillium ucsense TaxID=2839758 RepID=A0A8J8WCN4_9EURO|nr:Uncharacterized protein PECM_000017 [Penicillium ucsense]KAF7733063.1 Uncharacterized protein PECH_001216 [Penicillium ucsense]
MADHQEMESHPQAQATEIELTVSTDPEELAGDDTDEEEEYDPSRTFGDEEYPSSEPEQTAELTETPQPPPRHANEADQQEPEAEHDDIKTSVTSNEASEDVAQNPQSSASAGGSGQPQVRTIGGFDVDDEEEDEPEVETQDGYNQGEQEEDGEEADYEPPAVLGMDDSNAMPMTMSEDPSSENQNHTTSPDASSHSVQHSVSGLDGATSSYSPAPLSTSDPSASASQQWTVTQDPNMNNSTAETPVPDSPSAAKGRMAHDRVGILQDRVDEDPKGDISAWLELIAEHKARNRLDSAREVYERFLKQFPMAADQWVAYAVMESELNELFRLEQIFNRTLLTIPSVQLWSVYLDYVRRRNPLSTDTSGQARQTISSAYDLAIQYVGMDKDSGNIWTDYVEFIRSGPGTVGGSGWQDQQKMDLLRKAYHKALCVPTQAVNTLWKEYDQFEMGLNKVTGRKFLQEQSPSYMTARSSYTELQNFTRDLIRTSLPRLPPVPGSEGDVEFAQQVDIWKRWIAWEKEDPLVLKDDDAPAYKSRVLYVYKQALMALRFVPEMWFDAAEFCFLNAMENEGHDMLKQGMEANPESCLLAFKMADRLEVTSDSEQDSSKRAAKVREPYDKLLDSLYDLLNKARNRESQDVARIEEAFGQDITGGRGAQDDDDDDDAVSSEAKEREAAKQAQIDAVRKAHSIQINLLSKTISYAWIALMRAMRRLQGKGKPGELAGSRQVFAEARKRGRITSDVYIASALMEYHCYKDPAATKIFERGAKLFPEDENFALEYLKHLIDINDVINARAVFETTVRRLAATPENAHKAKPIFAFLHEYESRYGDLGQVISLESRMRELYPEDPSLEQFSHRFTTSTFNPMTVRHILSPSQTRPKTQHQPIVFESRATPTPYQEGPLGSPKRAYPGDDNEYDSDRPRKFARADSPLRGGQNRQIGMQKRVTQLNGQNTSSYKPQGSPAPLPRDVVHLLSIIPPASSYNISRLLPEKMVELLRHVDIPASTAHIPLPANVASQYGGAYR